MLKDKVYETQNLYEGAYLYSVGHKLAGINRGNSRKASVQFVKDDDIESDTLKYINNTATAPARSLFDSYRTLKDFVFER